MLEETIKLDIELKLDKVLEILGILVEILEFEVALEDDKLLGLGDIFELVDVLSFDKLLKPVQNIYCFVFCNFWKFMV